MSAAESTPLVPQKQCTKCKETFPATEHYFYKHPTAQYGVGHLCRPCARSANLLWKKTHHDRHIANNTAWKKANRAKVLINAKRYRQKNAPQLLEKSRAHRKKNRAVINARVRAWKKANPERVQANKQRRRAAKDHAPINDLTAAQWRTIQKHYKFRCIYCGKKPKSLSVDHIIPLSKGGSHTLSNVVPACISCNARKGNRPLKQPVQPVLLLA